MNLKLLQNVIISIFPVMQRLPHTHTHECTQIHRGSTFQEPNIDIFNESVPKKHAVEKHNTTKQNTSQSDDC